MARRASPGQIYLEFILVMILLVTVLLGAMTGLSQVKKRNQQFQFSKEKKYERFPSQR